MSYWTINQTYAAIDRKYRNRLISSEDYDIITATMLKNLIYYGEQSSNIGLVPLDNVILKNSINVINNYHLSADDSLHVYTAFLMKYDYFLCHDHEIVKRTNTEISNMKVLDITDSSAMNILTKELNTS